MGKLSYLEPPSQELHTDIRVLQLPFLSKQNEVSWALQWSLRDRGNWRKKG